MVDQFKVLAVNRPLFIHFVMAKYVGAKDVSEQLDWLIGHSGVRPKTGLVRRTLDDLLESSRNSRLLQCFSGVVGPDYRRMVESLNANFAVTPRHCGIVCAALLFSLCAMDTFEDQESTTAAELTRQVIRYRSTKQYRIFSMYSELYFLYTQW